MEFKIFTTDITQFAFILFFFLFLIFKFFFFFGNEEKLSPRRC